MRVSQENYFIRNHAILTGIWNRLCSACRYIIRAVFVSFSERDRTSFPSRSGTIYESVNLSLEGFSWRTGNEPCDRMWGERKKKIPGKARSRFPTTRRSEQGRTRTQASRYKFVCPGSHPLAAPVPALSVAQLWAAPARYSLAINRVLSNGRSKPRFRVLRDQE